MKDRVVKVVSYILVALLSAGTAVLWCTVANRFSTNSELANKQQVIDQLTQDSKLDELKAIIYECFIGDYNLDEIDDAAAAAIVNALGDPWSYYMTAEQYGGYQDVMNNVTMGVGMTVEAAKDGSGYKIIAVTQNSPAYEVGIQKNDLLVAMNGVSVAGADLATVHGLLVGEEGTKITMTILRNGQSMDFEVERKSYQLPVATYRMIEGNIGLISIENFDARCAEEVITAIETLREQGAEALIFDVRHNPGGYKSEMVKALDYLLPAGVIFKSEDYLGNTSEDRSDAACVDLPMAVLVNGNSYSAAEFFAAALDEYGVATVVGTKTSGKGYFQTTIELSDGSAVNLSIGKYYTPHGNNLAGIGLTPEVIVEVDDTTDYYIYCDALEPEEDPQIMAAVNALKSAK